MRYPSCVATSTTLISNHTACRNVREVPDPAAYLHTQTFATFKQTMYDSLKPTGGLHPCAVWCSSAVTCCVLLRSQRLACVSECGVWHSCTTGLIYHPQRRTDKAHLLQQVSIKTMVRHSCTSLLHRCYFCRKFAAGSPARRERLV